MKSPAEDWLKRFDIWDEEIGNRMEEEIHTISERGETMVKWIGTWVLVLGVSFVFLAGCGGARYRKMVPDYETKIARLKGLGGDEKAPYETTKAENWLKVLKYEADENDAKGGRMAKDKLDYYLEQGMSKIP